MAALEAAAAEMDARGVDHGTVNALDAFGIAVSAFRDPDNIQVELTASLV